MNSKPSSSISWFSRWTLTPTFMTEDPIAVRHSLVRLLAATNRNALDTRRALELFSKEHWGLHRFRLKQVLDGMDSRTPLLEALEKKPSLIGDQAMLALRLGQATGTVPAVWNELTLWERPIHTETAKVWRNSKAYWVAVAFAMMIVSLYFAWMIVPSLAYLEREFEFESNKELFDVHQMASFIYLSIAGAILFAICWIVWRLATWHSKSWLRRFAATLRCEDRRRTSPAGNGALAFDCDESCFRCFSQIFHRTARTSSPRQLHATKAEHRNEIDFGGDK